MTKMQEWGETFVVKAYETDFLGRWKPAIFFNVMQQAASHHAGLLGFEFEEMLARDMVWVLSRVKIRFQHFPAMGEEVNLRTWPKGIQQKLFFMRDFEITGASGRPLAAATSAWLLISPSARKILLPSQLPEKLPNNNGRAALNEELERLNVPDDIPEKLAIKVGYSDVDIMAHVNNARYIDWVASCFSLDHYRSNQMAWLQINYNNEVKPGEQVSLRVVQDLQDDRIWLIQGFNLTSGQRAFEAQIGWQQQTAGAPGA